MIAKIKAAIPTVSTARELYEACGISADKLERLLRDYMADDESAKPFRKLSRDEREAMVKAQIQVSPPRTPITSAPRSCTSATPS